MELTSVAEAEYPALIALWEASVRATHDFLSEADRLFYRERMPGYLRAVRLVAARDDGGRIVAFLGTAGATGSIEMLFVAPEWRGRGIVGWGSSAGGDRILTERGNRIRFCSWNWLTMRRVFENNRMI
ncbi:hypothetical protein [uncultured Rikenella sp.]|uniref:hypothetical protein n=1 Tax=uncultured Rikenella sp. TaxID=368003 RepID=UPI0026329FAE|nr:hypothetical protein [uncultured Rikenella sp.]